MLARYRNGCLTTINGRDGIERWLFSWRERSGMELSASETRSSDQLKSIPKRARSCRRQLDCG